MGNPLNYKHLNVSVAAVTDTALLSGKGPGVKYHIRDMVLSASADTTITIKSGGENIFTANLKAAGQPVTVNAADLSAERGNLLITNTAGNVTGVITYWEENMGAKYAKTPTQRLPQY